MCSIRVIYHLPDEITFFQIFTLSNAKSTSNKHRVSYHIPKIFNTSQQKSTSRQSSAPTPPKRIWMFTSRTYLRAYIPECCKKLACFPLDYIFHDASEMSFLQISEKISILYQYYERISIIRINYRNSIYKLNL